MRRYLKLVLAFVTAILLGLIVWAIAHGGHIAVLNPGGYVAAYQKDLLVLATALSALVVIPVFIMTFVIVRRYHAGAKDAVYAPTWDGNRRAELIWWGIPLVLIMILSGIIWVSSHSLDPYKALASSKKPLSVQVIALNWKWLFLYPEQNVASVNYLQVPVDTPINFRLTSDAPMNSFWVPQLGGQVYAMSGMSTQLHLIANKPGTYQGASANISGRGYAGMKFQVRADTDQAFESWIKKVRASRTPLTLAGYDELARPSENQPASQYSSVPHGLYDTVIMKYMMPTEQDSHHEEGD